MAKARKRATSNKRDAKQVADITAPDDNSAASKPRDAPAADMFGQLGSAPFFTLTQLVHAWTKQHADGETLANRRRTVRDNTINKGCPHVLLGVETVFVTESFVGWLRERENRSEATAP
jgi:hypothetical protein